MNWFKLAGSFHTHPKLKRLQSQFPRRWRRAVTLWTMAASWCAQHEKDGVIELAMLPMFMSEPGDADMLVAVGFWEPRSDDSFQFHDWFDFQLTANQLRTSRERAIERAQKSRKSRIVAPHDALPDLIRSEISSVKQVGDTEASVRAPALKPPQTSSTPAAKRAAEKLHACLLRWFDPRSDKHRTALEALGERPDAEWSKALEVIEREMCKPGVAGMLTPAHILDQWSRYSSGEAPKGRAEIQRSQVQLAAAGARYREL